MTLGMKASLLVCLGFIVGMTTLLDQVARSAGGLPSPVRSSDVFATTATPPPRQVAVRFAVPSVVERAVEIDAAALAPAYADARPRRRPLPLPPLTGLDPTENPAEVTAPPALANAAVPASSGGGTLVAAATVAAPATGAAVLAQFENVGEPREERVHRVVAGESLSLLASRYYGSAGPDQMALLLAANPQLSDNPDHVRVGDELVIPDPNARRLLARSAEQDGPGSPSSTAVDYVWYVVAARDSVARIAKRELRDEGRWVEIVELNELDRPDRIYPGMRLKLPMDPVVATTRGV